MTVPRTTRLLMAAALAVVSLAAEANVATYSSRASFSSLGSISSSYGFENVTVDSDGFLPRADNWIPVTGPATFSPVKYSAGGEGVVVGPSSGLGVFSNVFVANSFSPVVLGTINYGSYNLLGFDLGSILGSSQVNLTLHTNAGVYSFLGLAAPNAPAASFFGFRADANEHFTSFSIAGTTPGSVPALDNVTLGLTAVSAIPEPEMFSMLLPGLLLLATAKRRRALKPG